MSRADLVREAVQAWGNLDPSGWNTGLSHAGARIAQKAAVEGVLADSLEREGHTAPKTLVIWCASNVFTAPVEWCALFAALGSRVVLKAPSSAPEAALALAREFSALGTSAHVLGHREALGLLEDADALLAFGSDESLAAIDGALPEAAPAGLHTSLHGHRASFAVVSGDPAVADGLAWDAVLHDGRGCMSPHGIFCLGDPAPLAAALAKSLALLHGEVPPGPLEPWQGPEWRRRCGLARALGSSLAGEGWAVNTLPPREVGLGPLPRMLTVHPIESLEELKGLAQLPLSTCATDLDPEAFADVGLADPGFHRICAPGDMQRPPLDRLHDGVDLVAHFSAST
jgi:hypothetical protein